MKPIPGPEVLTPHQLPIARGVADGKTMKAISLELNVHQKTVDYHWNRIKDKTGIQSIAGFVHWAIATELIPNRYKYAGGRVETAARRDGKKGKLQPSTFWPRADVFLFVRRGSIACPSPSLTAAPSEVGPLRFRLCLLREAVTRLPV